MWYFGRSKQTSMKLLNEPSTCKQTLASASQPCWIQNSCEVFFIAANVLHDLFINPHPPHIPVTPGVDIKASLTVADGAEGVVVFHAFADDPPLGEYGVWADRAHVKGAPGSHQVIGADVTVTAPDGKVPVGQSKRRVSQHILQYSAFG